MLSLSYLKSIFFRTVTDEHENALSVTCTRKGEELICYDQNSRQYIFRL